MGEPLFDVAVIGAGNVAMDSARCAGSRPATTPASTSTASAPAAAIGLIPGARNIVGWPSPPVAGTRRPASSSSQIPATSPPSPAIEVSSTDSSRIWPRMLHGVAPTARGQASSGPALACGK